ncbi:MAG: hypothetical protein IPI67_07615 [Myxococcales bacterium]|nr:hypothetical protein [Myxococcales bacterium]
MQGEPVLGRSAVLRAHVVGERLVVANDDATTSDLRVELAARADGWSRVEDRGTGIAVEFRLPGAAASPPALGGGLVVYERSAPGGGSLLMRVTPNAVEDFVVLERAPKALEVRYLLSLHRVAGLRLFANTLEVLDSSGTPRLRASPPYIVDSAGANHSAILEVEGCFVDASPVAPWGRAPIPPGSEICELRVSWPGRAVRYPAVLDPKWSTTGQMETPRHYHTATRMKDGRVLVAGRPFAGVPAEIFDPSTNTWAVTSPLLIARYAAAAALLDDGRVLVAGGSCDNGATPASCIPLGDFGALEGTAELYDPETGKWAADPHGPPRSGMSVTRLESGSILFAGGCPPVNYPVNCGTLSAATLYDQATGTWTELPQMPAGHSLHTASPLPDGRVMLVGSVSTNLTAQNTVTFFNPASKSWAAGPPLAQARGGHAAVALPDGRILVSGGLTELTSQSPVALAEAFDPVVGAWSTIDATPRAFHQMVVRDDQAVLIVGGGAPLSELFTPTTGAALALDTPGTDRIFFAANKLEDGRVLVSGGWQSGDPAEPSSMVLSNEAAETDAGAVVDAGSGGTAGSPGQETKCGPGTVRRGSTCVAEDSGCGCRTPPPATSRQWSVLAALCAGLPLIRRARSRRKVKS